MKDLFEHHEELPLPIQTVINNQGEIENYNDCRELLAKLEVFGYTFEYGLDSVPYNLRKVVLSGRFIATIKWLDNGNIQDDMILKIGDIEEDDDDIFFYLDSERELEEFKKEGVHDWVILDVVKE